MCVCVCLQPNRVRVKTRFGFLPTVPTFYAPIFFCVDSKISQTLMKAVAIIIVFQSSNEQNKDSWLI